jgi:hypothetical protein
MSSAILYLAIIAIWAGFLVPAWVRRPHAVHGDADDEARAESEAGLPAHADGEPAVEYVTETENGVEVAREADRYAGVSHSEASYAEVSYAGASYGGASYGGASYGGASYGDPDGGYEGADYGDAAADYAEADYAGAYPAGQEPDEDAGPGAAPRLSQSREQMLRARRRMLTILVSMTLVTGAFTFLGLVNWWICVPPAGMLALYVLLLREIAMADAELARKRAAWQAREARAREHELQAEREAELQQAAHEAAAAHTGAQIIDISGRVSDQLYDQYADAAVRAVGD